jgi:hypothetical protein
MRDRFLGEEVWSSLGLPREVTDYVDNSEVLRQFRGFLFVRIVPILRHRPVGRQVQKAFADMGVLAFADADIDAAMAEDEAAGDELDARMARVKSVAAEA